MSSALNKSIEKQDNVLYKDVLTKKAVTYCADERVSKSKGTDEVLTRLAELHPKGRPRGRVPVQKRPYTILTEEKPHINEIMCLIWKCLNVYILASIKNDKIIANIRSSEDKDNKKKFEDEWTLEVYDLIIKIKLFKGTTSCVDYILAKGDVDWETVKSEDILGILESTKTSDNGNGSRNTAVMQRISKFIVFKKMYLQE